jgi:dUTP pyrophosphatase
MTRGIHDVYKLNNPNGLPPVRYTIIGSNGKEPTRTFDGDAGFDLYAAEDVSVPPGEFRDVPTHIAVQMPPKVWGRITGRSSTLRKRGLLVIDGVIDNQYRGEMFFGVFNLSQQYQTIEIGDRLAQFILHPIIAPEWWEVDALTVTERGEAGFGSTGR